MDRVTYFINKLLTFVSSIHPMTYLIFLLVAGMFFVLTKLTIQKFKPQMKNINGITLTITLFIGLPVLGL